MTYSTTIAGSLPKPGWLAETERLWPNWRAGGDELREAKRDATRIAIAEQARSGIECVSDGEQSRIHFVHGFLEALDGIDSERKVRKGIRGDRYQADCPSIVGEVARPRPVHLDEVSFARSQTRGPLKFTLPGPMTIVDTLYDAYYGERRRAAFAFAKVLNAEIRDLVRAGVDVVQLDEPAFNVYFEEVEAWGIDAIDAAFDGIGARKAVHVCYGYGIDANKKWKSELGAQWDQYAHILPFLSRSCADELSLELAGSRVPVHVLAAAAGKDVAVGVVDVASDEIETAQDVQATLEQAVRFVPAQRLIASTNCGMAPMNREIAYAKLHALGAGTAAFRKAHARGAAASA